MGVGNDMGKGCLEARVLCKLNRWVARVGVDRRARASTKRKSVSTCALSLESILAAV